jgi:hypothetical protein
MVGVGTTPGAPWDDAEKIVEELRVLGEDGEPLLLVG